ncbi:hypothetical protein L1887_36419 [Cichorium endivia]|nr:hypothetical protein L1887_36419 [Cichorium endivia]
MPMGRVLILIQSIIDNYAYVSTLMEFPGFVVPAIERYGGSDSLQFFELKLQNPKRCYKRFAPDDLKDPLRRIARTVESSVKLTKWGAVTALVQVVERFAVG